MSIVHCFGCDIDFDSDYHDIFKLNDLDACENCYDHAKESE